MSEEARQAYQKVVEQAHEKFSETVRLAMLSLLGFVLFCLLITFSTPDSALLVADPTVKMPFADVQVSFHSFLFMGPFFLILVTLYLHIFYGYWLDLETDYQHLTRSRESSEASIERLPTLFSLDHPVPRLLTTFIFYWLVPLILVTITWKAAVHPPWGLPLMFLTGLVTAILVFLQIRRCPASQRQRNRLCWLVMVLIMACLIAIGLNPQRFERQLNIFRADLKGKWLVEMKFHNINAGFTNLDGATLWNVKLPDANFRGASLQGADLWRANLQGAFLWGANLRDANLWGADLSGANLQGADLSRASPGQANLQGANLQVANLGEVGAPEVNLQEANLRGAYLRGANLSGANLQGSNLQDADLQGASLLGANLAGANLRGADLRGADLQAVEGLTEKQIQSAQTDGNTKLPSYLKIPRPAEPDEAAPPPAGTPPME